MTVEDAVSAISSSADGEECAIIIAGDISEALGEIAVAIKNNYYAKIILDLGGATGLTEIPSEAFSNCQSLRSVNIPSNITSIGEKSFYGCVCLLSVNIPDAVTSIGNEMFFGCGYLTSIVIPSSVTSIGRMAFASCGLISVTIPYGVISISDNTFTYCYKLTAVSIPASVTSIDTFAFYDCVNLTTVNYGGTQAQWEKLINGVDIALPENTTVKCSDGDI